MNWLNPSEVKAWIAQGDAHFPDNIDGHIEEALEHFVLSLAEVDFNTLKYPERASNLLVDVNEVARLLAGAMKP